MRIKLFFVLLTNRLVKNNTLRKTENLMSPKSTEQFNQIREESKQRILDAALMIFAKKGYDNASISMIAKEAGVSKGLMYNYFSSKEDLLKGVIMGAMDKSAPVFQLFMIETEPKKKIKHLIDGVISFLREHKGYYRLITALALQEDAISFVKEISEKKIKELMPVTIPVFEQLGFEEPQVEAEVFGTLHDGLAVRYLSTEDEDFLNRMHDYLLTRYTK